MDAALPPLAGIDIDGVIADPTHRLHHLRHRPKRWRSFFAEAADDPPLPEGVARVADLRAEGMHIVYVSGRPARLRELTELWLGSQGLPTGPMYLRPHRDFRPAPVLKREVYLQLAGTYTIGTIVDDDDRVVRTLRESGLPAVLADWYQPPADDQQALSRAQDQRGRT